MSRDPSSPHRPRPSLSVDRILVTGVHLADVEGLSAVSMRAVAQQLGVEAMSLYRHVANKDALLDGMVEQVIAEIRLAEPGEPWRESVRRMAESGHEVLLRHPWAGALVLASPTVGPVRLRYVEALLGCLRRDGFTVRLAHHALHALDNHVFGFTEQELRLRPGLEPLGPGIASVRVGERRDDLPYISEAVLSGVHEHEEEYTLLLEIILDGFDARQRASVTG